MAQTLNDTERRVLLVLMGKVPDAEIYNLGKQYDLREPGEYTGCTNAVNRLLDKGYVSRATGKLVITQLGREAVSG